MRYLRWIIAMPLVALALFVDARVMICKPNSEVVKVATPMVEKIADYIVDHGVPNSLRAIPDLPYKLEGCKRNTIYEKEIGLQEVQTENKKDADWVIYEEQCGFNVKNKIYSIKFWFIKNYKYPDRTHGKVKVILKKTSVGTSLESKDGKLESVGIGSSFDNRAGFCRPFKQ